MTPDRVRPTLLGRVRGAVPFPIVLPPCLMDSCRAMFPTLDFSRIVFYLGIPRGVSGADGFTMSSGGAGRDIRIYLKSYDPCSKETFLLVTHELVHALQIQGMIGGGRIPGSWVTFYMSHAVGRGGGVSNALENEAYSFTNGTRGGVNGELRDFVNTHLRGAAPCAHTTDAGPTPTTIGGVPYFAVRTTSPAPTKAASGVGPTWRSLINWPVAVIAGAFSVFGFSNSGGAVGAIAGIVGGGATGLIGAVRLRARGAASGGDGAVVGAVVGAVLGAYAGGLAGGAFGWCIGRVVPPPSGGGAVTQRI